MRNWIAAALILVLGLSLTACGNDNAGTTANRWNDAAQQQANARGPIGGQSFFSTGPTTPTNTVRWMALTPTAPTARPTVPRRT